MSLLEYEIPKLQLLETPIPELTDSYSPVPHRAIIETVKDSLYSAGFSVENESYTSARGGMIANGRYVIKDLEDGEMKLQMVWQNSYDKSMSFKFAIGGVVMICSNGMVAGDMGAFKRKHTGDATEFVPLYVESLIKDAAETFDMLKKEKDHFKLVETSLTTQAELLGRLYIEQDIITSTQLNVIKREMKDPSFDYKCPNTLWEIYNHATFALKQSHPQSWMKQHIELHDFFREAALTLT